MTARFQLRHQLLKIIGTIGKHGKAVIVGRGANFILPPEDRFRVRIIAPMNMRVEKMTNDLGVSTEEAKRHILKVEADRRAFIRKYFYADIANPINYELVINTGAMTVETTAETVINAYKSRQISL